MVGSQFDKLKKIGGLELTLGATVIALIAQLFPEATISLIWCIVWLLDIRNWDGKVLFLLNLAFVLLLVVVRFRVEIKELISTRSKQRTKKRQQQHRKPLTFAGQPMTDEQQARYEQAKEWSERAENRRKYH